MDTRESGGRWEGRPILCKQEVMLVKGVLFVRGMLTLFSDELLFEPIRGIDKLAGAQDLRFAVADLSEVEGDRQELSIVVQRKEVEFRGRGAGYVLDRLDVLLQHRQGIVAEGALFEEDERVLVQGPLESHINALLSARGTVTLTTQRFRFQPDGFFNRMVGASLALDVPLAAIEAVEVVAVRRLLRIRLAGSDHLYAGALVPVLYSRVLGLLSLGLGDKDEESNELLAEWAVSLFKGPLAQPGSFLVSTRQITFTVDGTLDSMIGLHTLVMPVAEIDRLAAKPGRGVLVTCDGETRFFEMDQADERLRDLFAFLLHFRDEREPAEDDPAGWTGEEAAQTLERMAADLTLEDDEQVLLLGPALQWMAESNVRRGSLVVTSLRLLFVPSTQGEKLLALDLQELRRVPFGEELTSQLQILAKRRHLRFGPRGGSFFIERFWATVENVVGQVGTPAPIEDEELLPGEQQHSVTLEFLPRNMGEVKYIDIKKEERLIKRVEPGETLRQPDGLGIFYPGLPSAELAEGEDVFFELGRDDGIYRFETTLLRIDTVTTAQAGAAFSEGSTEGSGGEASRSLHVVRDNQFLLVVKYPEDLRFLNRRHGFRVSFDVLSRVRHLAPDEEGNLTGVGSWFRCTIEDLATIGCAIRTPREIQVGAKLALELPLRDRVITAHATCVRRAQDDDQGKPPLCGVKFDRLSIVDEDTLHLALNRRQRQSLPLRG